MYKELSCRHRHRGFNGKICYRVTVIRQIASLSISGLSIREYHRLYFLVRRCFSPAYSRFPFKGWMVFPLAHAQHAKVEDSFRSHRILRTKDARRLLRWVWNRLFIPRHLISKGRCLDVTALSADWFSLILNALDNSKILQEFISEDCI